MSTSTETVTTVTVHVVVAVPLKVRIDENNLATEVLGQDGPLAIESGLSINVPAGDAFVELATHEDEGYGKWRMADDDEYDVATAAIRALGIE